MIVISDTTPLHYLIKIRQINLLDELFSRVIIPKMVYEELSHPHAPAIVRLWASELPDWIEIQEVIYPLSFPNLDPGETEAISLAVSLNADIILMDERRGRQTAREQGLTVMGTLGVLEQAAIAGLIEIEFVLVELQKTNFRISEEIIQEIIERVQQRLR